MVGGGGPANFFGAPHRRGDPDGQLGRADRRRAAEQARRVDRRRPASCSCPRGYPDWQTMIKAESALPESERIDYVTIVTPNDAHFGPADAAAAAGIGVLCEKPLTTTLDEARRLHATVRSKNVAVRRRLHLHRLPDGDAGPRAGAQRRDRRDPQGRGVVSPGLAGHQARGRQPEAGVVAGRPVQGGRLGLRRRHRHPRLRVRPVRRRAVGRRGSAARLKTFVPGRALDDDFTVLAELNNGGIATITASQVTIGAQNDNGFRVSRHDRARSSGRSPTTRSSSTTPAASRCSSTARGPSTAISPASIKPYLRLPSGHPEGFHEALANLHRTLEWTIRGRRGETVPKPFEHPGIADGVAGMAFIEAAVASSQEGGAWVDVPDVV